MINKNNIRAIYKPDAETSDGILYFYPQEVDGCETLMWVCEKDPEIKYFFDIPFLDDNWEIQQRTNEKTSDGDEIWENDVVHIKWEYNEFHDWDEDNFKFYIDKNLNLCIHRVDDKDDSHDMLWIEFSCNNLKIEKIIKNEGKSS